MKKVRVLYYGLIADIPKEGIDFKGELSFLPFSLSEPPFHKVEQDGSITFQDWIAILEVTDDNATLAV